MKDFFKNTKKQIIFLLTVIFISMLLLNIFTPLIADDYNYSFNMETLERLKTLPDIINNQIWHYLNWGGRSVVHSLANLFLLYPKIIFSIANSFIYTLLVYLIYYHAKRALNLTKDIPLAIILINFLLWFTLPTFGQTCLWLTGSCNYLWSMVLILLFLIPYQKDNNKTSFMKILLMFILGVLAGWTNENTAFGLIIIILGLLLKQKYEKKQISLDKIWGLIGAISGFIIMIAAPGNYVRSQYFIDNSPLIIKLIKRFLNITATSINYLLPLIILLIIFITINIYKKKNLNISMIIFIIGMILTIYAMCLSPFFPPRAYFGTITFMIIAITILFLDLNNIKLFKYIMVDLLIILGFKFISEYALTFLEIKDFYNMWQGRINYIIDCVDNNKEIELITYDTNNPHHPKYGIMDYDEPLIELVYKRYKK